MTPSTSRPAPAPRSRSGGRRVSLGVGAVCLIAIIDPGAVGEALTATLLVATAGVVIALVLAVRIVRRPIGELTVLDAIVAGALMRWWHRRHHR